MKSFNRIVTKVLSTLFISIGLTGCPLFESSDENDPAPEDGHSSNTDLFDSTKLLTFRIFMDEQEWSTMKYEGKPLGVIVDACNTFEGYTQFRSRVEIDGVSIEDVEIRKKGALGSLSSARPSIKLDVGDGKLNEGREFRGHRRITLNNNHQDPSNVEQCLAYSVFEAAGIKAPRCNLARVFVQGIDRGIYTHIENIKKPFLARAFGDDSGNLYEGEDSDFNAALIETFQKKTNEIENDRSDLTTVLTALESDDDTLWNNLDQIINMNSFLTYVAIEALIGHTDSYSASQGNFYIYRDPADNRFYFIPWGVDQTFQTKVVSNNSSSPNESIYLRSELTYRMWEVKDIRDRYDQIMQTLLDTVWNETELLAEVDRLAALAGTSSDKLTTIKDFINSRRAQIEAELGDDNRTTSITPKRSLNPADTPDCLTLGNFTATFNAVIVLNNDVYQLDHNATFSLSYARDDQQVSVESDPGTFKSNIKAELDTSHSEIQRDVVFIRFSRDLDNVRTWVTLIMPPEVFTPGAHPFHAFDTYGVYGLNSLDDEGEVLSTTFLGFIGDGTLTLNQASLLDGSTLSGSFSAKAIQTD